MKIEEKLQKTRMSQDLPELLEEIFPDLIEKGWKIEGKNNFAILEKKYSNKKIGEIHINYEGDGKYHVRHILFTLNKESQEKCHSWKDYGVFSMNGAKRIRGIAYIMDKIQIKQN